MTGLRLGFASTQCSDAVQSRQLVSSQRCRHGARQGLYSAVFQVTLEGHVPRTAWLLVLSRWTNGVVGAGGALMQMQGAEPGKGGTTVFYFACADCALEESRWPPPANGQTVVSPKDGDRG